MAEHHFNRAGLHVLHDAWAEFGVIDHIAFFVLLVDAVRLTLRSRFIQLLHPQIRDRDDLGVTFRRRSRALLRACFVRTRSRRIFKRLDRVACVALNLGDAFGIFHGDDSVGEIQFTFSAKREDVLSCGDLRSHDDSFLALFERE